MSGNTCTNGRVTVENLQYFSQEAKTMLEDEDTPDIESMLSGIYAMSSMGAALLVEIRDLLETQQGKNEDSAS